MFLRIVIFNCSTTPIQFVRIVQDSYLNMSSTGYKAMLRDRVPFVVNLALKWCSAKGNWVDHVYDSQISIYATKEDRYDATRHVLGLKKHNREFDFHKSIDWDNITSEESEYWRQIEVWVTWFKVNHIYIKNIYDGSVEKGKSIDIIKDEIKNYLSSSVDPSLWDKLVTFLINNMSYEQFP